MAHQLQLEKAKYRQWAKAGLGLGYLKEGLSPFCQDIANQQHKDILDNIQQTKSLPLPVTCGTCQLRSIKPDHVKAGNKVCPYGQVNCNCWFSNGKIVCQKWICGAIYDHIIQSHASTPPAPNWKNTDSQLWTADPWSIAKCYINAPGYDQKTSAADTDCTGLLNMIINNRYFHNHIACDLTRPSNFSKVPLYRNEIFHSSSLELDEKTANSYIDDMISILQDGKELINHPDSKTAVLKLQDLKNKDFVITSESFEELLKQIREEMVNVLKSTNSTKEECEGLKIKLSHIETLMLEQKEEIKRLRLEDSLVQKQQKYEKAKAEWRNKVIQEYLKTVLKVPAMPLLPDETCEFSQIYVRPTIVTEVKDEKGETKETEVESMSEIFTKNGVPLKSVYVVGDAGTGKSSFCKYLVNCWCMAHSEGQIVEDKFDGVNEMKKFEFLFLISLRHNQNIDSVNEMVKNQYEIDILDTLLDKESTKMIILLDGLDEWSGKTCNQFQTFGLPKHDIYKHYTIVTTSRPWKIHTLRIRDSEIQQMLKLKGFDYKSESEMIKRTVSNINSRKGENKSSDDCRRKLQEKSLRNLKQVPIMLQQLICLWFDCKLDKTSRCVVYIEMLELFFSWNEDKTVGTSSENADGYRTIKLPAYIADKEMCELNSHLIYDMSRLAYETLFNCPKDKSLTFDISVCKKMRITDEFRKGCLKLGILTEDRCPNLSVSERPKSMFSFIHKSFQEFLAAVNIAINFISRNLENVDLQGECIQFVKEVFKNCLMINEVLEQSNVIILLSGVEPRLATNVSRYLYDIIKEDPLFQRYRKTIDPDVRFYSYVRDIQYLIFDSMNECNTSCVENSPTFYIGDLYIDRRNTFGDIICSSIDEEKITPDFVRSIYVDNINTKNVKFSTYLQKFKYLQKIHIKYKTLMFFSTKNVKPTINEVNNYVVETTRVNASTLKSLSLSDEYYSDKLNSFCKEVVCILPSMNNLVAIQMKDMTLSHDVTTKLFDYLEGTSQLEQIHIDIKCDCRKRHDLDLSKHQQLQYLNSINLEHFTFSSNIVCVTDIDTVHLEILKCWDIKSTNFIKIFDSIMKCDKLKELELYLDFDNKSQSFHHDITERLVSVLPLLHNLSELRLTRFKLTDNILQVPSEMKSLKSINLGYVTMTLITLRKFVDNLSCIPNTVDVTSFCCYITEDDEELNVNRLKRRRREMNEAIQYVKDRKDLFIVKDDGPRYFKFSTRK